MLKKIHTIHKSAKSTHYDFEVHNYDAFNETNSKAINTCLEKILRNHRVKSVLDVTCGTGSQVFWLAKHSYEVVGSDISTKMLKIARDKVKKNKIKLKFIEADMRTVQAGKFDAVISIFNAVGHLTKPDFIKAMRNINKNLNEGGLFVFDIFNLTYLLDGDNITKLSLDRQIIHDKKKVRELQFSTIDETGLFPSYGIFIKQDGKKLKITHCSQSLQVYTVRQLSEMLQKSGFKIIQKFEADGSSFSERKSERMLIVAKKI